MEFPLETSELAWLFATLLWATSVIFAGEQQDVRSLVVQTQEEGRVQGVRGRRVGGVARALLSEVATQEAATPGHRMRQGKQKAPCDPVGCLVYAVKSVC